MSLFGRRERDIIMEGIWHKNPITYLVMGICSALAVTVKVETAFIMALGVMFVMAFASMTVSALRHQMPVSIRIIVQILIISILVIIADQFLRAFAYDISKQMSIFVGLIITNTLVLGRTEGFALGNPPWRSFLDGFANGTGYGLVLVAVAAVRELLGNGKLAGLQIIPESLYGAGYANNGIMILAPGAFFLLGIIIWIQRAISGYREER
ncbi:MAG: NADH:ubiquinone reductase (Na(+)-transporting) subunit D [Candidatus Omnitrophica bacterium]|nr:NADH:ubiquinone reductase (Na(+)-transporting) subunit D [Candidatus Omnitrophota bacterium]